ncbi:hypothetical protein [Stenotrophomonas bentonitica]|uniref:hypothetical protein n=1 Tax=Stenotrophomonas bentonitica TaxID=1450134 RepID=UPI00345E4C05
MSRKETGKVALHVWDAKAHLQTEDDIRWFLEASHAEAGDDAEFVALTEAIADEARKRLLLIIR